MLFALTLLSAAPAPAPGIAGTRCALRDLAQLWNELHNHGVHIREAVDSVEAGQLDGVRISAPKGPRVEVEGGTNVPEWIEEVIAAALAARSRSPDAKLVRACQTGFNAGVSALALLCALPSEVAVHSFDLGAHHYVHFAARLMDKWYPGRHTLTLGNSLVTLAAQVAALHNASSSSGGVGVGGPYQRTAAGAYCDYVFVDGGHSYQVAWGDIANFRELAAPGTTVVVENCNVWGKSGGFGGMIPVNQAYTAAIDRGLVKHYKQVSLGECDSERKGVTRWQLQQCREMCVGKFT